MNKKLVKNLVAEARGSKYRLASIADMAEALFDAYEAGEITADVVVAAIKQFSSRLGCVDGDNVRVCEYDGWVTYTDPQVSDNVQLINIVFKKTPVRVDRIDMLCAWGLMPYQVVSNDQLFDWVLDHPTWSENDKLDNYDF